MSPSNLPAAVEGVLASPLDTIISTQATRRQSNGSRLNTATTVKQLSKARYRPGGALAHLFHGYTPESLPQSRRIQSHDIAENRYIKQFLIDLEGLLKELIVSCKAENKDFVVEDLARWSETVAEWLSHSLWRDIGQLRVFPSNSQRLQKAPAYQDLLSGDMVLKESLSLPWAETVTGRDSIIGDIKPVSELYEYWCFFVVRDILQELYGPDKFGGKGLTTESAHGLVMRLASMSDDRCCTFEPPYEGIQIHLFFNRNFPARAEREWGEWSGSYSFLFHPDISIAISKDDGQSHWLNFDAKYKVQRSIWTNTEGKVFEASAGTREYKQDDLNKMHCYRDAILGTRGAYILYPGFTEVEEIYVRRASIPRRLSEIPGVGAIALRPGNENQRACLMSFIQTVIGRLINAPSYQEETGPETLKVIA
jgi:predicted component of viral defense system (DUF524 family)